MDRVASKWSTQHEEGRLLELAARTEQLRRLAAAITVAPGTIAARDHEGARAELEVTAQAIDEVLKRAGTDRTPAVDLSGRLSRIATTLDRVLFMGGVNTTGERSVRELRKALVAFTTPTLPQ